MRFAFGGIGRDRRRADVVHARDPCDQRCHLGSKAGRNLVSVEGPDLRQRQQQGGAHGPRIELEGGDDRGDPERTLDAALAVGDTGIAHAGLQVFEGIVEGGDILLAVSVAQAGTPRRHRLRRVGFRRSMNDSHHDGRNYTRAISAARKRFC